jgi:hypothetical protein
MIIDLCCGQGRFPGDDVISIDTNPAVRPTIVADVQHLPLRADLKPELVHASPPCKYFSFARSIRMGYDERGIAESLRIVAACFDAFVYLKAKKWTLENPYYGLLQRIMRTDIQADYSAYDYEHKKTSFWSNNRALKRALIPQEVRQRILDS